MKRYWVIISVLACLWQQWERQIVPYAQVYVNDLLAYQHGQAVAPYHARILLYEIGLLLSGGDSAQFFTVLAFLDLLTLAAALISAYVLLSYVIEQKAFVGLLLIELAFVVFVIYPGGFIAWSWMEMAFLNVAALLCWRVFALPRWSSSRL